MRGLGLRRRLALGEHVPQQPVHRHRCAFGYHRMKKAAIGGFEVVVQLLGLDLRDDVALADGVALRFRPARNRPLHHEVAQPGHYDRGCHGYLLLQDFVAAATIFSLVGMYRTSSGRLYGTDVWGAVTRFGGASR